MKRLLFLALGFTFVGCSASSDDAPPDDVPSALDASVKLDAGKDAGRDAGSVPMDAGSLPIDARSTADTYVPPLVQDSGGGVSPGPDASTGGGGGSSNPLCATFPAQCCANMTDPACLDLLVIFLTQVCCAP